MDTDPYCLIDYTNGDSHDLAIEKQDLIEMEVHINGDMECHVAAENVEVKDYEVKECTTENLVKTPGANHVVNRDKEQDVLSSKTKSIIGLSGKKTKETEVQKIGNPKKLITSEKLAARSVATRNVKNHTVPQPFALATEKRASSGARPVGSETSSAVVLKKPSNVLDLQNLNTVKKAQLKSPVLSRKKPLQSENGKHADEDDACSVASSNAASVQTVKFRVISASKRKEFYSKLEEKHQALEAEWNQCEARTKFHTMSVEYDHDDAMSEKDVTVIESMSVESQQPSNKRKRNLTSKVWKDFDLVRDQDGNQKAICKHCKQGFKYDSTKGGTSTLSRHLKRCPKQKTQDVIQLLLATQNGAVSTRACKIDQTKYREFVAALIIGKNLPFNFVEWPEFRNLCNYLNADVQTISRNTTRADIIKMHKKQKEVIRKRLECTPGKICLTSDMWTSVNTTRYISLTAHFVDKDWVLQKFLLNFSPLPPPHTGQTLSDKMFVMLNDWGIEGKVGSISLDNAANNGLCVKIMKSRFIAKKVMSDVGKKHFHIHCCAHIISLIVKEGLTEIDPSVIKIRMTVKYIKASQIRKQNFLNAVRDLGMSVKVDVRQDVKTRWNSTYLMLESCIAYQNAFTHLRLMDPDYAESPTEEEWKQIKVVTKFLKVFYDLTTLFSGNKYPTSNLYFDGICQIRVLLEQEITNELDFVRNMATKMKAKFDKYWKKLNPILAMAVVLDPRLKFAFVKFTFKKLYHTEHELKKEVDIIYERMTTLFEEYHTTSTSVGSTSNVSQSSGLQIGGNAGHRLRSTMYMQEFAAEQENGAQQSDKSELDQYLSESTIPVSQQLDILQYWKGQEQRYPTLTRMATYILAIPISTVASESAFSLGGRVLDRYHSSLSSESAEALITTRDWIYGIGVGSSDFVEVKDNEISEDILGFESMDNNEAIHIGAT